jgi:hypothetical protein
MDLRPIEDHLVEAQNMGLLSPDMILQADVTLIAATIISVGIRSALVEHDPILGIRFALVCFILSMSSLVVYDYFGLRESPLSCCSRHLAVFTSCALATQPL